MILQSLVVYYYDRIMILLQAYFFNQLKINSFSMIATADDNVVAVDADREKKAKEQQ